MCSPPQQTPSGLYPEELQGIRHLILLSMIKTNPFSCSDWSSQRCRAEAQLHMELITASLPHLTQLPYTSPPLVALASDLYFALSYDSMPNIYGNTWGRINIIKELGARRDNRSQGPTSPATRHPDPCPPPCLLPTPGFSPPTLGSATHQSNSFHSRENSGSYWSSFPEPFLDSKLMLSGCSPTDSQPVYQMPGVGFPAPRHDVHMHLP